MESGTAAAAQRVARIRDALAGGHRAGAEAEAGARLIRGQFPGAERLVSDAWGFHERAAAWAVTEAVHALPARALIFTAAGLPRPRRPGAAAPVPLHAAAAALAPSVRACYVDASGYVTLMRHADTVRADPLHCAAACAPETDPAAVLGACERAGVPAGGPVSVHVVLAPQRWDGVTAVTVLAAYREMLAPGSTVCLSLGTAEDSPAGDRLVEATSRLSGQVFRHSRPGVAAWVKDAGMILHPQGVADARAPGRDRWAQVEVEMSRAPWRVLTVVAVVPGRR